MKIENWLTINKRGSTRLTKSKPHTAVDEISILLQLELPKELFTRPRLSAQIKIPDTVVTINEINAQVVENIEEAIKSTTGLDFRVSVIEEKRDNE